MFGTGEECYTAVRQGRADAAVNDYALLLGAVSTNPDLRVAGAPFGQDPYGIGVPKNHPEMKTFVNGWLKKIEDMGLWKRVFTASFGDFLGEVPPPPAIGSVPGS
jgi:glutamate transport system substrate-binding protein